jgi:hypothetical protein
MSDAILQQWVCSVDSCNRSCQRVYGGRKGMCPSHYRQSLLGITRPIQTRQRSDNDPQAYIRSHSRINSNTGCWEWIGYRTKAYDDKWIYPYGVMRFQGKIRKAHRVSACAFLGFDINSTLLVCHTCDNPCCVNPNHLFIGTHKHNNDDMRRKGRGNYGAKLTEAEVTDIRQRFEHGESVAALANAFHVHYGTVHQIIHRKLWKTV